MEPYAAFLLKIRNGTFRTLGGNKCLALGLNPTVHVFIKIPDEIQA